MGYVAAGYWACGYADPCVEPVPPVPPAAVGYKLLLSEPLPLRTTRMLGDFAESLPLPILIGDLTAAAFPLIRLTASRYFVADHPAYVAKVFVDKQEVFSWTAVLESDQDGHTWTVVLFAAPIPAASVVSATGRGKLDDVTGALIENPADVAQLIYSIAGRTRDWSQLRAEASGLTAAGRLWETLSIRAHVDAVLGSFGAIWAPGMAQLYPRAPQLILDLDKGEVGELLVTTSTVDTADVLRLSYDYSDAAGKPLHYMQFEASPQRYGGAFKEVTFAWLRTPKDAEAIGRPQLQRLAGERYDVTFKSTNRSLRPGMAVRPVAHPEWPLPGDDPVITILAVELTPNSLEVNVTGETIRGEALVTLTAHSIALPDTITAGVEVEIRDGIATFTFTDEERKPLQGARVSLDGSAPKTTDALGKVRFPINVVAGHPVNHELAFEKAGFTPFTVVVPL